MEDTLTIDEETVLMKLMGLPTEFTSEKVKKKKERKSSSKLAKYKYQRYRLFSRFDEGIQLDHESWYSVTPEEIAKHIAQRCVTNETSVVLDPFCGAGGSAIQFALASPNVHVIAVDIDPTKIHMARINATIYQVENRIDFILGDFLHISKSGIKADVVFLSPPWGGPNYLEYSKYKLDRMTPDGNLVFEMAKQITSNIAFYVPRNSDEDDLMKLAGDGGFVDIEENCCNGKVRAKTAYYGDLVKNNV